MTKRFDVLTQQLFQKNVDECTVEELEQLVHEHPYFAPAQYALLTKLKESNGASYAAQFQKAILYYHDALSFDHFISEEIFEIESPPVHETEEIAIPGEIGNTQIIETTIEEPEEQEKEEELNESLEQENHVNQEIVEEQNHEQIIKEEIVDEKPIEEIAATNNIEEKPEAVEIQNQSAVTENIEASNDLTFEPYHTVDYFASQGIKLSQEEATKDKFGKQLKSFTEWLKTMKRIPAAEQVKALDDGAERKVENLAAHSVEGEEVYTETMAEVWVRQGNSEKAREIYNKLSLLNPSKRAYFAAKIDSLK